MHSSGLGLGTRGLGYLVNQGVEGSGSYEPNASQPDRIPARHPRPGAPCALPYSGSQPRGPVHDSGPTSDHGTAIDAEKLSTPVASEQVLRFFLLRLITSSERS
jgi:hypothetical protein